MGHKKEMAGQRSYTLPTGIIDFLNQFDNSSKALGEIVEANMLAYLEKKEAEIELQLNQIRAQILKLRVDLDITKKIEGLEKSREKEFGKRLEAEKAKQATLSKVKDEMVKILAKEPYSDSELIEKFTKSYPDYSLDIKKMINSSSFHTVLDSIRQKYKKIDG